MELVELPPPPPPPLVEPPPPPPPAPPVVVPEQQIVETEKVVEPSREKVKSKLLSEQNQRAEKQTVSKKTARQAEPEKSEPDDAEPVRQPSAKKKQSASLSNVKDVEEGLETLLNTSEFKFFSYFNRLQKHMGSFWENQVRQGISSLVERGLEISAGNQLVTKLYVVIGSTGELRDIIILQSCGYDELDQSVIKAFKAAAPFAAPPTPVLESDGTVKITWDFVLE